MCKPMRGVAVKDAQKVGRDKGLFEDQGPGRDPQNPVS